MDSLQFHSAQDQFTEWLAWHGLPANADLQSDTDGDGQVLLMEYAFRLDPRTPHARDAAAPPEAALPKFTVEPYGNGNRLICRFLGRGPGSGLRYEVSCTNDPARPADFTASYSNSSAHADWQSFEIVDPSANWRDPAEKRFGRVRVTFAP